MYVIQIATTVYVHRQNAWHQIIDNYYAVDYTIAIARYCTSYCAVKIFYLSYIV